MTGDKRPCPYCQALCEADWVDVGIPGTMVQCGPFHCLQCGAYDHIDDARELTEWEEGTGWYAPGSQPGSSANVIGGKVVSAEQMKAEYRQEFVDNPLWHDKEYVAEWWKKKRTRG